MKILGIDLGSREVKYTVMEAGEEGARIVAKHKVGTMTFYRDYCTYKASSGKLQVNLPKLAVGLVDYGVSTGYGRNNTDLENFQSINELKAHAYGAIYQTGLQNFVLLDIGGQDVKIIKVEKGIITDLDLNDKCAASCGRYLENMAQLLEVPLDKMSLYYEEPVEINSTCAVFSESSLIGLVAQGLELTKLCAGVNYSLYKRLRPLIQRFQAETLIVAGGVAQNQALIHYLHSDYNTVLPLPEAQLNGAIGCCYYAYKKYTNKNNYTGGTK